MTQTTTTMTHSEQVQSKHLFDRAVAAYSDFCLVNEYIYQQPSEALSYICPGNNSVMLFNSNAQLLNIVAFDAAEGPCLFTPQLDGTIYVGGE